MYFRYFERSNFSGTPPSPVHILIGIPFTSFKYATAIAIASHILGDNAPMDISLIIIG